MVWNGHKSQCPQGHPYNEENTYWYKNMRMCRICRRTRNRKKRVTERLKKQ